MSEITNWLPDWQPQDDICVIFDDKTGADRAPEEIDRFFIDIKDTANKHGFDINTWGSKSSLLNYLKSMAD